MAEFSEKTGIAVATLSALTVQANRYGSSQGELQVGLRTFSLQLTELAKGGEGAIDTFRTIGLVEPKFRTLDTALRAVMDRFHELPDGFQKTEIAVRLFGRAGEQLIPFLNQGSKGLDEVAESAKKTGAVWEHETAESAKALMIATRDLNTNINGFASALVKELLPSLIGFTQQLNSAATESSKTNPVVTALAEAFKYLLQGVSAAFYGIKMLGQAIDFGLRASLALLKRDILDIVSILESYKGILMDARNPFGVPTDFSFDKVKARWKTMQDEMATHAKDAGVVVKDGWDKTLDDLSKDAKSYMGLWDAIWKPKEKEEKKNPLEGAPGAGGAPPAGGFIVPPLVEEKQTQQALDNEINSLKILQGILESDPFKTQAEKKEQLLALYKREQDLLTQQIYAQQRIESDATRTSKEKLDAESKEIDLLGKKAQLETKIRSLESTNFIGTMRQGLVDLSNAWENLGQNVAGGVITSIHTAVDGLGQSIVDVIAGTKTWGEVFTQIGRQIIATILQILINWIVSMTIVRGLKAIFGATDKTEAAAAATAWTPAAILASIGSYGGAAVAGLAAFAASLASGIALGGAASAVAAFAEGGQTPGSPSLIQVSEQGPEYILRNSALRKYGVDFLDALNSGRVDLNRASASPRIDYSSLRPSGSAPVNVSPTPVNIALLHTEDEIKRYMESKAGEEIITRHVRRNKNNLGIRS